MRKIAVVTNITYNGQPVSQLCSDANELFVKSQAVMSAYDSNHIGDFVSMALESDTVLQTGIVTDLIIDESSSEDPGKEEQEPEEEPGGKEPSKEYDEAPFTEYEPKELPDKEEPEELPGKEEPKELPGKEEPKELPGKEENYIQTIKALHDGEEIELTVTEWGSLGMLFPYDTDLIYTGHNTVIVVAIADRKFDLIIDKWFFIADRGWYTLYALHENAISLEKPENIQLWNTESSDWISALRIQYTGEINKDDFNEDMYAIPSLNIGYTSLSDLQDIGFLLEEPPNCNIYIAGNANYTSALRQPNNDNWETISY